MNLELHELKSRLRSTSKEAATKAVEVAQRAIADLALYTALCEIDWDRYPWANYVSLGDGGLVYYEEMPHFNEVSGVWKPENNKGRTYLVGYIRRPKESTWTARDLFFARPVEKQERHLWPFAKLRQGGAAEEWSDFVLQAYDELQAFIQEYEGQQVGQVHTYRTTDNRDAVWGYVATVAIDADAFRKLSGLPDDAITWAQSVKIG